MGSFPGPYHLFRFTPCQSSILPPDRQQNRIPFNSLSFHNLQSSASSPIYAHAPPPGTTSTSFRSQRRLCSFQEVLVRCLCSLLSQLFIPQFIMLHVLACLHPLYALRKQDLYLSYPSLYPQYLSWYLALQKFVNAIDLKSPQLEQVQTSAIFRQDKLRLKLQRFPGSICHLHKLLMDI